jgi:glycosyltransferase involved in cell wall biosynthesis
MSEPDNIIKEAIGLIGAEQVADVLARRISSRSFLIRQLVRCLIRGRNTGKSLGMVDVLRQYGNGAAMSALPSTGDLAKLQHGIGIYGLFTAEIGIGQSARRSAQALRAASVPLSLHNITVESFENRIDFEISKDFVSPYDTALIHLNPDSLLHELWRCPIEALVGRRRIGFWHWELPVFPAQWTKAFEKVHEVWAPSSFVARTVAAASDLPIRVVPHAVPGDGIPQDIARKALGLATGEFLFLTIFDLNSFPMRKNPIGVVQAFLDAFPSPGPSSPRLIVKCHGKGNRNAAFDELLGCIRKDNRIMLFDEVFSVEKLRHLRAACDCYVSLHRSEGFGLNILESMVLGKPCIATGFSGNMDFMTPQNSIIIPFEMRRVAKGEYPHGEGQWWAEPDHEASVEALRQVVGQTCVIKALARQARDDALRNYSFERVGELGRAAWLGEASSCDFTDRSPP